MYVSISTLLKADEQGTRSEAMRLFGALLHNTTLSTILPSMYMYLKNRAS